MEVAIRPWAEEDFDLGIQLLGDPEMTCYLGGPESLEQIRSRHQRYVAMSDSSKGRMFVIVAGEDQTPAGSVGYWERETGDGIVWETGWSVLPEFQGRGIATSATALAIERVRDEASHRFIHAYPSIENAPSNAICRKLGFTLLGVDEFEYPPGNIMRCNDWQLALGDEGIGKRD